MMATRISFAIETVASAEAGEAFDARATRGASGQREEEVTRVICAGYAGRDQESVRKHIEELKALGVPAPAETPAFYSVPPERVTTADSVRVRGRHTSGEVEFVLFKTGSARWSRSGVTTQTANWRSQMSRSPRLSAPRSSPRFSGVCRK